MKRDPGATRFIESMRAFAYNYRIRSSEVLPWLKADFVWHGKTAHEQQRNRILCDGGLYTSVELWKSQEKVVM